MTVFFCPCKLDYNKAICLLYCIVPAFGCLICTWFFLDLSTTETNGAQCSNRVGQRVYSIVSVLIWVSLFFIDSRYVACAGSYWEGIYTKSDTLEIAKWCKPIGNETSVLESEEWTLHMMIISQVSSERRNMLKITHSYKQDSDILQRSFMRFLFYTLSFTIHTILVL